MTFLHDSIYKDNMKNTLVLVFNSSIKVSLFQFIKLLLKLVNILVKIQAIKIKGHNWKLHITMHTIHQSIVYKLFIKYFLNSFFLIKIYIGFVFRMVSISIGFIIVRQFLNLGKLPKQQLPLSSSSIYMSKMVRFPNWTETPANKSVGITLI